MSVIGDYVSREALDRINQYISLLIKWNEKINLISKNTIADVINRHILDSLQLQTYIRNNDSLIDLGSGAGLPGMVLSIAGVKDVTLIESDSRKCAFLLQASKLSYNEITIINKRIEDVSELKCNVLTSRAFASLEKIFNISSKIGVKNKYLLHKGAGYRLEIEDAKKHWLFNQILHDSITSKEGKILEISNLRRI